MTITIQQFTQREVIYCVSTLIYNLYALDKYCEDLAPIMSQDDWQAAAEDNGWSKNDIGAGFIRNDENNNKEIYEADSWQELCEDNNIDPQTNEALEHWIVSDYLADKLEAKGEMILRDFHGLTLWGRTTSGQAIYCDGVIGDIYTDLTGEKPSC